MPGILFAVLLLSVALLVSRFFGPNPLTPAAVRTSALQMAAANADPQPSAIYTLRTGSAAFLKAVAETPANGSEIPPRQRVIGVLMQGHFILGVGPSAQKTDWIYLTLAPAKVYNNLGRILYDPGQVIAYGPTTGRSLGALSRLGKLQRL